MKKLSIIMPAYNEEKRIGNTLEKFSKYYTNLEKEKKIKYEIYVVINGTRDDTEGVVKKYQKENKRIKYIVLKKGGKGFAVIRGFEDSLEKGYDYLGFVDADLATGPYEFWNLVLELARNDGAVADRYDSRSKIFPPYSLRRSMVSKTYSFIVRSMFYLKERDTQCGAKVFRKEVIEKILPELKITNWAFDVNILHLSKKQRYKIKSVPTVWYEIEGGHLNVMKTSVQMFFALIQLRILKSPFRKSLRLISPLIGKVYGLIK